MRPSSGGSVYHEITNGVLSCYRDQFHCLIYRKMPQLSYFYVDVLPYFLMGEIVSTLNL